MNDDDSSQKRNHYSSYTPKDAASEQSFRQQVIGLLDKNPLLSAKYICQILQVNYKKKAGQVRNIKSWWKRNYDFRQGLKSLSFHKQHWKGYALKQWDRRAAKVVEFGKPDDRIRIDEISLRAVNAGWRYSKSRNRMLVWKDDLGRIEWFETGTILLMVHEPASTMKLEKLLSRAFLMTSLSDLVGDIGVYRSWVESFYQHDGHLVYDTGQRLPYARISLLKESNGVIITTGDRSHPTSIEVQYCFPDYAEKTEQTLRANSIALTQNSELIQQNVKQIEQFSGFLKDVSQPKPPEKEQRYIS